jgi:hypothetical protein
MMSGSEWAWAALAAVAALTVGGLGGALLISYRRGRRAEHVGEHRRRRGGRR